MPAAYQECLFAPGATVEVSAERVFRITEDRYAPNWIYDGGYRFRKHGIRRIGDLEAQGEEFEYATVIDGLNEVEAWIKNISRRPETSFWLPTSTDRFYPDFVARLVDGKILVVEYKGPDRYGGPDANEKLMVGNLWEARSGGRCLFVMPTNRNWDAIRAKVAPAPTTSSTTSTA
jgi:type III restriction enzyme